MGWLLVKVSTIETSVSIVLELAPLTLRKFKDDNKTREIQNLHKISIPPSSGGGEVKRDFPRWRECLMERSFSPTLWVKNCILF